MVSSCKKPGGKRCGLKPIRPGQLMPGLGCMPSYQLGI